MQVLILGATGFIGTATALRLLSDGHKVSGLSRQVDTAARRMPQANWIKADLANYCTPNAWEALLENHDVIVNCAGALQDGSRDDLSVVHEKSMLALYTAAASKSVRVIHLSAPRSIEQSNTKFMATKLNADAALSKSGLDHVILRPAVVIGRNAYGGSALLRALAAFPFVTPLLNGDSKVECVHIDAVTKKVSDAVNGLLPSGSDIDIAQAPHMSLSELVALHRAWLGLAPARAINVPITLAAPVVAIADVAGRLGWRSPLRSTAIKVAKVGVVSAKTDTGGLKEAFLSTPAGAQDLWFSRLYLLKPVMILTLSLFWLTSGLVPLADIDGAVARFGASFPADMAFWTTIMTCMADILLGTAVLWRKWCRPALIGMILLSVAYLVSGTLIQPFLWLDPLGPLVKVLPSILLTLATLTILEER